MATLPEIKHSIRTSTAAYISAYFEEHETYPVDIGLIHGDFIAEELYEGISWSDEINGFYEFSGGAPAAPLLFDRWISLTTTGDYQANWYYEWDGLQWNEISPKIGKPYWIKSQELHRYFNGDIWAQLAGVVGTTDHRELSNLNSAGYWHLTELEYDYFSGLSNLLGGKESVGVAAGLVAAHENTWDHDSFLTALPEHEHDSRYYTEIETDALLDNKQNYHKYLKDISSIINPAQGDVISWDDFLGVWTKRDIDSVLSGYEKYLGLPDEPGYLLTSTVDGVRSWVHPSTLIDVYSHPTQSSISLSLTGSKVLSALSVNTLGHVTNATTRDLTKSDIGLSNVDNTSDLSKPISTATQTALDIKQPLIAAGTTNQFLSWDKTMQEVDWTYIANKPSLFPPNTHSHLAADMPSNVVYTDSIQTITGPKTFSAYTTISNTLRATMLRVDDDIEIFK